MIKYNSHTGEGKYKLEIETDNRKYFEMVEEIVRLMIDKELYFRVYNDALAVPLQSESRDWRINKSMINPSCVDMFTSRVFDNTSALDYVTVNKK